MFEVGDIIVCINEKIINEEKRKIFIVTSLISDSLTGEKYIKIKEDLIYGYEQKFFMLLTEYRKMCIEKIRLRKW